LARYCVVYPTLWANLYLEAHPRLSLPEKVAEFITLWFSRAGPTLALSFHFIEDDQKEFQSAVRTAFLGYASRLRFLHLHCDAFYIDLPGPSFPLLRELHLSAWFAYGGEHIEAFRMVPLLHKLTLDTIPPSKLKIPWQQLTHVVASGEFAEAMTVLHKAPYLRKFEFDGFYASDRDPGPAVLHSSLTFLSLRIAERLIALLTLRAVKQIVVSGAYSTVTPLPLILSHLLRSFTFGTNTPAIFLGWFHHMEHLTTLELDSPKWPHKDELIHALNRAHMPQFLPKLQISRSWSANLRKSPSP
jgi:hypothetical protein